MPIPNGKAGDNTQDVTPQIDGQITQKTEAELQEENDRLRSQYDELKSNSTRGAQKLLDEKKQLAQQLFDSEANKVEQDGKYILDLYEKNPDIANKILNENYNGLTIDEARQQFLPNYQNTVRPNYDEIYKEIKNRDNSVKIENMKNNVLSKYDENQQKEIIDIYNIFSGNQNLNETDAKSVMEFSIQKVMGNAINNQALNMNNINLGTQKNNVANNGLSYDAQEVLRKMNINPDSQTQNQNYFNN